MSKHIPERTCIVCRKKAGKENFIKIVRNSNGLIFVEKNAKLSGRGAYVCNCDDCINNLKKSKALSRTFKTAVNDKVYEEIINDCKS